MRFHSFSSNDLPNLTPLQPEDWPDIKSDFEFYLKAPFCYPIKAVVEKRIVGLGTLAVLRNTAWLAHIIVHPDFRKQGIGLAIVYELLGMGKKHRIETFLLAATPVGKPVYERAGFRICGEYQFFQRVHPWVSKAASVHIRSFTPDDEAQLLEIDRMVSGENRTQLITPFFETGLIYADDEGIQGFYLPDLKEGLIYALKPEAGIELMKIKYAEGERAVIPTANSRGIDFLLKEGFEPVERVATRMVFGDNINWRPELIYGRIGGNFG